MHQMEGAGARRRLFRVRDTAGFRPALPDRITRTTYGAVGQVTKVETGYGVSGVAADEATMTYRNNGQVEAVTDANGNKTTYVYDGLDRLSRTHVPDPSTAGTSSTTDYQELTYATATDEVIVQPPAPFHSFIRLVEFVRVAVIRHLVSSDRHH